MIWNCRKEEDEATLRDLASKFVLTESGAWRSPAISVFEACGKTIPAFEASEHLRIKWMPLTKDKTYKFSVERVSQILETEVKMLRELAESEDKSAAKAFVKALGGSESSLEALEANVIGPLLKYYIPAIVRASLSG